MATSTFIKTIEKNVERKIEELEPFWETFAKENDRTVAITSVCLLDNVLEKLIQASYVKDSQVKSLFKNDHILQSFFAKVNIAYFSGLIPKVIYHDLKLICEIRNRFAHAVIADLRFTHETIAQRIGRFALGPKTISELSEPRVKFITVISQIVPLLQVFEQVLSKKRSSNLVELFEFDQEAFPGWLLTQSEIHNVLLKD